MSKREKCRGLRSIWFTDEKTLTLDRLVYSQNDRVYSDARKKKQVPAKRLVREREHFSDASWFRSVYLGWENQCDVC